MANFEQVRVKMVLKSLKNSLLKVIFLLSLFNLISSSVFTQALSGTYTIGGNSPDYSSFTAAVSDLNTLGINGNVIFNVRPGDYEEQIQINQISGSSSNNQITFQSSTGNAEDVVLKHKHTNATVSANYTIYLNGTRHISFKDLTIQAIQNIDYCRVVNIHNNANSVLFERNRILSWKENSIGLEHDAIAVEHSANIIIRNNYIEGGNAGVSFNSGTTTPSTNDNRRIEGNTFRLQHRNVVKAWGGRSIYINENDFSSAPGIESYGMDVIYLSQIDDIITVKKNKIFLKKGGCAIYMRFLYSDSILIANNMIDIGVTQALGAERRGIYTEQNDSVRIYHNTINVAGNSADGEVIFARRRNSLICQNNIFVNSAGNRIYNSPSSNNLTLLADHNILNSAFTPLATINGTNYSNISSLRSGLSQEVNSAYLNPNFYTQGDLIPLSPNVYNRGVYLAEVRDDFYGNMRSNSQTDPGCYEGSIPGNDAGVFRTYTSSNTICPSDSFNFLVRIQNLGTNNLDSAIIYLEIDDTTYQYKWRGLLGRFAFTNNLPVARISLADPGEYDWKVYTSMPNGVNDSLVINDTLDGTIKVSFKGHFIVGPSPNADFDSLEVALSELKKLGICDSTFLDIESGTYARILTIPNIPGSAQNKPLVIQSLARDSSAVTFTRMPASQIEYIFRFNHARNTILRDVGFFNTSWSRGTAITFEGNSLNIKVENCKFHSNNNRLTNGALVLFDVNTQAQGVTNMTFRNNYFLGGNQQFHYSGRASNQFTNLLLEQNIFEKGVEPIYLNHFNNAVVQNNEIRNPFKFGIEIENSANSVHIRKNNIYNINPPTHPYYYNAIIINDCSGSSSKPINISNNFITLDSWTTSRLVKAFDIESSSHINLYHNSINHRGGEARLTYLSSNISHVDIKNNIFFSKLNPTIYYIHPWVNLATISSNYNCFVTSDTNQFYFQSSTVSLQNWQSTQSFDQNSVSIDPFFTNDSNLYVNNPVLFNNLGTPLNSVSQDIEGDARDPLNPDIGADEFDIDSSAYFDIELERISRHDAGNCNHKDSVFIKVVNHSNFTIDSFASFVGFSGGLIDSLMHYDSIPPGDTIEIFTKTLDFNPNTNYELDVRVEWPNGRLDNKVADNHIILNYTWVNVNIIVGKKDYCTNSRNLRIVNLPYNSIQWTTGGTTPVTQASSSGNYGVTVVDNKGCSSSTSITIP